MVQWLRLCAPNAGGPGLILDQGPRKSSHASVQGGLDHCWVACFHVESKPRWSLTYIRQHPDAALHRGLLAWHEPVAVVNPEHTLQQLHEDGLASLQERGQGGGRVKTFICE